MSTTSSTSSTAPSDLSNLLDDLGDVPLSEEELKLLESLQSQSATAAQPAPEPRTVTWNAPAADTTGSSTVSSGELHGLVGRSLEENLLALGGPLIGFRGFERRAVLFDQVLLEPFAQGWLSAPPRFFEQIALQRPGPLSDVSRASALHLRGRSAPTGPSLGLGLTAESRSADRSTGLFGTIDAGLDVASVRASVSYNDYKDLRTGNGDQLPAARARWNASARARILGRAQDPVELVLGIDLDRALNVPLLGRTQTRIGRARFNQLLLAFLRSRLSLPRFELMVLAAYQGLRREVELSSSDLQTQADGFQARLKGRYQITDWLWARAGGHLSFSQASATTERSFRRLEGFAGLSLAWERAQVQLDLRLSHQRFEEQTSPRLEQTRPLAQGRVWLKLFGPLALRAVGGQGFSISGDGLLAPLSASDQPSAERSVGASIGPSLRTDRLWLDLMGFFVQLESPLASTEDPSAPIPPGRTRAWGLELEGRWMLIQDLYLAGALAWAEAYQPGSQEASLTVPALRGLAALRYVFQTRSAFVELRLAGATEPFFAISEAPSAGFTPYRQLGGAPQGVFRFGLMGGLDLGAGFRLELSIQNLLDRNYQSPSRVLPDAGIDLRAALSYDLRLF